MGRPDTVLLAGMPPQWESRIVATQALARLLPEGTRLAHGGEVIEVFYAGRRERGGSWELVFTRGVNASPLLLHQPAEWTILTARPRVLYPTGTTE